MAGNLSPKLPWDLANTKWASVLNPVLANPLVNGFLLPNISLVSGTNVINHFLSRHLQGYIVVLKSANVDIYDSQQTNQKPDLTLQLISSGSATVTLYVF